MDAMDTTHQILIRFLKNDHIDYVIAPCNSAGLSVFYFIEQRIVPLSKELSGIVLPHDSFGTHLNENGKTIDNVKELENLKKAGELLSEISSEITIDLYQPSVKWVNPSVNPLKTGGNKKVTHT